MIGEDEMDEIIERARALGTDYAVLADLLRLMAEVRRLRAPLDTAESLRLREAEGARIQLTGAVEKRAPAQ